MDNTIDGNEKNLGIRMIEKFVSKKIVKVWSIVLILASIHMPVMYMISFRDLFKKIDGSTILFSIAMVLLVIDSVFAIKQYLCVYKLTKVTSQKYIEILRKIEKMFNIRLKCIISLCIIYVVFSIGKSEIIYIDIALCLFEKIVKDITYVAVTGKDTFKFSTTGLKVLYIIEIVLVGLSLFSNISYFILSLSSSLLRTIFGIAIILCIIYIVFYSILLKFVVELNKSVRYTV